jgi:hypothetical protein
MSGFRSSLAASATLAALSIAAHPVAASVQIRGEGIWVVSDLEIGAIRDALIPCWNAGADDRTSVELRFRMDPSTDAPVPDSVEVMPGDGEAAAVAAARRAVLNPACHPWPRPRAGWPAEPIVLILDPTLNF